MHLINVIAIIVRFGMIYCCFKSNNNERTRGFIIGETFIVLIIVLVQLFGNSNYDKYRNEAECGNLIKTLDYIKKFVIFDCIILAAYIIFLYCVYHKKIIPTSHENLLLLLKMRDEENYRLKREIAALR